MSMLLIAGVAVVQFVLPRATYVRPHVVLVVLDTVRADHVAIASATNVAGRDTTPFLRSLASDGVAYPEARADANWTLPSHASMFTGLLPSEHGCHFEHRWLDDSRVTLAEDLSRRFEYATAAFSANPNVSRTFNVLQGFKDAYETKDDPAVAAGGNASDAVLARATDWIVRHPRRPCFVFVNLMDAHLPYDAAPGHERAFGDAGAALDRARLSDRLFDRVLAGDEKVDAPFAAALSERYDAAIRGLDARLERFVAGLPAEFKEHLVLIVASDHGEDLGDHGLVDHQGGLTESLLRVPLVLHGAGVPRGEVARSATPLSDLFRIVQDLVNGDYQTPRSEAAHPLLAERMVPVAVAERLAPRRASLSLDALDLLDRREQALVIPGQPWKLVHREVPGGGARDVLFGLGPGIADEVEVKDSDASRVSEMSHRREQLLAGRRVLDESLAPEPPPEDEAARRAEFEALAAIGYASGPPRAQIGIHGSEHLGAGNRAFARGDFALAEREFRAARALAPGAAEARFNLALTLSRRGDPAERDAWVEYLRVADAEHGQAEASISVARQRLVEIGAAPPAKTSK